MARKIFAGLILCCFFAVEAYSQSNEATAPSAGFKIPNTWTRRGVVIERQKIGRDVCGDPCIVWDPEINGWRMVFFCSPPGHAQAICTNHDDIGPGQWKFEGPLPVTNPDVIGGFHKPFIVMDPDHPNQAAKIDGRYCLLVVNFKNGHKEITRAWSEKLAGPWTFEPTAIIPVGAENDFDAKHTDAVTGYYFPERKEFLYFYMGYPKKAQSRKISPYGNAQAAATQKLGEKTATKLGVVLEPCQETNHWASGWVGGLQLLRGAEHKWVAVVNASPTAPDPGKKAVWTEEPAPSLGGFAWCDEDWPVRSWHFAPQPIEWIQDVPKSALDAGEGFNLWRQFIHILPDGRAALFYNSGYYGREQLYLKVGDREPNFDDKRLTPVYFTNKTAILHGSNVLAAVLAGERQGKSTTSSLRGAEVVFVGATIPSNVAPATNADLLLRSNVILRVDVEPYRDVRPQAVFWETEVLGTLSNIDFKNRIIHIRAKPQDWRVRETW